jgi:DNA mismatch repair protein MutL
VAAVPRIRVLPDAVVNQIAAGEVVERPASVAKELIENALDAGAGRVSVLLRAGGCELLEVEDDGEGMDCDDALLAFERHATSKIVSADDLAQVTTLGFRGEALPSIAAAAHVTLETAPSDGEGTRVEVAFGRIVRCEPCARPRGTRVAARGLFERLPARRKFLRTEATELRHVVAAVSALALTHTAVSFTLQHGDRSLLRLPAVSRLDERLADLLGAARMRSARPVRHASGGIAIEGVLVPAARTAELVVAVNGRAVRDRVLAGAVNRALRDRSGRAEADAYLLVTLPTAQVDVNVHPTKAEVRFTEPSRVVGVVTQALAASLIALRGPVGLTRLVTVPAPAREVESYSPPASALSSERPTAPQPQVRESPPPLYRLFPWGRYIGQYRDSYLLLDDGDGLVLIDQHVAHERVLFERLLAADRPPAVQGLLLGEVVELTPALAALAHGAADELRALGVELEPVSGNAVRVLGVPAPLPTARAGALVAQVLQDLAADATPGAEVRERVAASLACHAAITKNRALSRVEAEGLLTDLAAAADPHRCPHGRPIIVRVPHAEIERRVGRR